MYCNYCGKFIEGESGVCADCQAARAGSQGGQEGQNGYAPHGYTPYGSAPYGEMPPQGYYPPQPDPYYYSTEPEPHNRMFGFGKALASTVMSFVGFVFAYITLILAMFSREAGLILLVVTLGLLVTSLVFGIGSIACFNKRRKACAKNIPTLVLGINGVATAAFGSIYAFVAMILVLVAP